jgi:hypothetical protein
VREGISALSPRGESGKGVILEKSVDIARDKLPERALESDRV